jgi:3D (Asp-Asp-Asp) domain-containing protein
MRKMLAFILLCPLASSCIVVDNPIVVPADMPRVRWQDVQVVNSVAKRDSPIITVVSVDPKPAYVIQDKPVRRRTVIQETYVNAVVTAYCPCSRCCGRRAKGLTRLETSAWQPGVAADWKHWPAGTMVIIEGYNNDEPVMVDDTGGDDVKGKTRFDIRMTYHWQARNWGRQPVRIRVVSIPEGKS